MTDPTNPAVPNNQHTWGNYVLQTRYSQGYAARCNRRHYSGKAIHRIVIQEIVKVIDEGAEQALNYPTLGKRFLATRKPVIFSSAPACGCTQGQHAAQERVGAIITCKKCT